VSLKVVEVAKVAKVKKTYSLEERSADLITVYARAVGISPSAFVALMVTQISQVLTTLPGLELELALEEEKEKREAGRSGDG
jgi:hypothetical protein